jgi:probable rRNA maturation factor
MIYLRNDVPRSGVDRRALIATAKRLLANVGERDAGLSLSLVDDESIRTLNRVYRGKDRSTDVLSFGMNGMPHESVERLLGDIVISIDTARRQAADYDAPLQHEIYRLLIHGLLHITGHDHELPEERRAMRREERRLAEAINLPWPYARGRHAASG